MKSSLESKTVSWQRLWSIKQRRKNRCVTCGKKAVKSKRKGKEFSNSCAFCMAKTRERSRKYSGAKRRNLNSLSYQTIF